MDHHAQRRDEMVRYWIILAIAFAVSTLEFLGSRFSGSEALEVDAWHAVSHAVEAITCLVVAGLARRRAGEGRELRIRIVGARLSGLLLLAVAVNALHETREKIASPVQITHVWMLTAAAIGLLGNIAQLLVLKRGLAVSLRAFSLAGLTYKAMRWHTISDLLLSVAVVLGGAIGVVTGTADVDPALTGIAGVWVGILGTSLIVRPNGNGHHHHEHAH